MRFGEALAKRRKEANLSQEQLAEKLHVSRQAVSKWESDRSTPDIYTIQSICDVFGVSVDTLLSGITKEEKETTNERMGFRMLLSIFMIVVFISGVVLFVLGMFFYKETFEPLPVTLSFFLCGASMLYFIAAAIVTVK